MGKFVRMHVVRAVFPETYGIERFDQALSLNDPDRYRAETERSTNAAIGERECIQRKQRMVVATGHAGHVDQRWSRTTENRLHIDGAALGRRLHRIDRVLVETVGGDTPGNR